MNNDLKKLIYVVKKKISVNHIFIIFLIFSFTLNTLWIVMDNYIPRGNGGEFVTEISQMQHLTLFQKVKRLIWYYPYTYNPPLLELIYLPYYHLFGVATKNELVLNSFFLVILLISVYKIGEKIYSKKVGLLSAIIINSFYITISLSKMTYREFHLLSFTTLAFWLMLETDYLRNKKYSILFGITLGLTALIKYVSILYLFPQTIVYILYSLYKYVLPVVRKKKLGIQSGKISKNMLFISIILIIIAGFWYVKNILIILHRTLYRFVENPQEINKKSSQFFSMDNIFFHLEKLFFPNIGFIFGSLFLLAFIRKIFQKKKFEETLLIISFIVPYILLILIPIKGYPLLYPSYFVVPILISDFLFNLKIGKKLKQIIIILIIIFSLNVMIQPFFSEMPVFDIFITNGRANIVNSNSRHFFRELNIPRKDPSIMEKVFYYIENQTEKHTNTNVLLISNGHYDYWDLVYLRNFHKKRYDITAIFKVVEGYSLNWIYGDFTPNYNISHLIKHKVPDYVIVFFPDKIHEYSKNTYNPSFKILGMVEFEDNYHMVKKYDNPDEPEEVLIYKLLR